MVLKPDNSVILHFGLQVQVQFLIGVQLDFARIGIYLVQHNQAVGIQVILQPVLSDFQGKTLLRDRGIASALETSSFADPDVYRRTIEPMAFVMADIKLLDPAKHREYCGADNGQILENLRWLMESGKPFVLRVPLVPGITDTRENLAAIADFAGDSSVELLPYNAMAGAKYASVGAEFGLPELVRQTPEALTGMAALFRRVRVRK